MAWGHGAISAGHTVILDELYLLRLARGHGAAGGDCGSGNSGRGSLYQTNRRISALLFRRPGAQLGCWIFAAPIDCTSTSHQNMDWNLEATRLLERDAQWSTAASEGRDIEHVLSYWTDDAIVIPPGMPAVVGKAALRQYVEGGLRIPGFGISWTSTDVAFSPDGHLAYMFSANAVTMNAPDGQPFPTEGRAVTIWRREADGE